MIRACTMTLAAALLAVCTGCAGSSADHMSPQRLEHGLVFSLDGVGGYNWGPRWLRSGLDEAQCPYAFYIFDWGHGPAGMFFTDLWDTDGNQRRASELADLILNYQKFYPGRPVFLIGHSGGGGMVDFTLEQLPEGVQVDVAFLLAPALDPGRNLAPALRHVRKACYVTYSAGDVGLMGLGTSVFTTMDGKHTVGAGLVGFRLPPDLSAADRAEYAKLRQASWNVSLVKSGALGGHMGWSSPGFARDFIAPILAGGEPAPIFRPIDGIEPAKPTASASAEAPAPARKGGAR